MGAFVVMVTLYPTSSIKVVPASWCSSSTSVRRVVIVPATNGPSARASVTTTFLRQRTAAGAARAVKRESSRYPLRLLLGGSGTRAGQRASTESREARRAGTGDLGVGEGTSTIDFQGSVVSSERACFGTTPAKITN